jgi:hypothetical protein
MELPNQLHEDFMVDYFPIDLWHNRFEMVTFITLPNIQLSFCGPLEYINGMFEKLRRETQIPTDLPTSHSYITRAHIAERYHVGLKQPT